MPKIFSLFINSFSSLKLDYHPAIVQRQGFSYFNGGDLEEIRSAVRRHIKYNCFSH